MTTELDPAVRVVESNLLAMFERMEPRLLRTDDRGDVFVYTSDSDFPLFNGVSAATFPPDVAEHRAGEVLDEMMARGKPFVWWTTDSTRTPELLAALEGRGMVSTGSDPGMHLDLSARDDLGAPEPSGPLTLSRPTRDDIDEMTDVFMQAFGVPPEARAYAEDLNTSLPNRPGQEMAYVVAQLEGEPAGCGLVMMVDGVAGLYDIGVLEGARRRGVGAAVTRELLRIGHERGCHTAVLYASELGHSVYEAVGFATSGSLVNYAWLG